MWIHAWPEISLTCVIGDMDMNKYTSGPWFISSSYPSKRSVVSWIDTSDGFRWDIAEVAMEPGDGTKEANARLIAAAPDLLEAVQAMMIGCRIGEEGRWLSIAFPSAQALNLAVAAIAKVRGES
jgi:hypothetical protein